MRLHIIKLRSTYLGIAISLFRYLVGIPSKLGEGYSDTLRTIIMNWLSEKVISIKVANVKKSEKTKQELAEEVELLDTMLTSIVELLHQKKCFLTGL